MEEHYPQACPFCKIALAFPPDDHTPVPRDPDPERVDPQCHLLLSTPLVLAFLDILPISQGHVLLITRQHAEKLSDIPAFPKSPSERSPSLWRRSFPHEGTTPAQALGFWMPLISRALSKTLEFEDWNVVQNNGHRAAQVVPHVHFHFIPRYPDDRKARTGSGKVDVGMLKSWKMFGRGAREELDDDEGKEVAALIREGLRVEVEKVMEARPKL
ncbi:HIT-like domain-containing protein [Elsinoe ampelina]|uniref:HIT-like domain-containing protein n=1 Tax=Elsinoe ampelina TaxID=302913 RepID=A0A6A6GBN4_9PEZI|nr:HIT-like domain-containing protein [Elsinoe ampelina]